MTAAHARRELLSLADWRALPDDEHSRLELQEGLLVVQPSPTKVHALIVAKLMVQFWAQLPTGIAALTELEVVIDPATPATVRIPDVVVCPEAPSARLDLDDVFLVVEVLSPGTRRTDLVTKRSEYADAGIEHYWIIDPADRSLTALTLSPDGYQGHAQTGTFTTERPFPLTIDLDML
ncbi:Uma2 family endonuclease [Gordonia sp. CPCC 205515]|uniref:Uma2 family endonuclease n=1 Tax=Gordonia sp. CPCC 205515 TaxID=3140791 RepID=UPI003AF34CBC